MHGAKIGGRNVRVSFAEARKTTERSETPSLSIADSVLYFCCLTPFAGTDRSHCAFQSDGTGQPAGYASRAAAGAGGLLVGKTEEAGSGASAAGSARSMHPASATSAVSRPKIEPSTRMPGPARPPGILFNACRDTDLAAVRAILAGPPEMFSTEEGTNHVRGCSGKSSSQ